MNCLLHVGVLLVIIKKLIILFLLLIIGNILSQNKSVSSAFNRVSRYILFLAKLKGRERPFLSMEEGGHIVRLPPRALGCYKRWKSVLSVKFDIILLTLYFLLDPFTNKHCRT